MEKEVGQTLHVKKAQVTAKDKDRMSSVMFVLCPLCVNFTLIRTDIKSFPKDSYSSVITYHARL